MAGTGLVADDVYDRRYAAWIAGPARRSCALDHEPFDIAVAGHICLDIIPELGAHVQDLGEALAPGGLVQIGPAVLSTGGPVSNTGLALHRLGARTRLFGKVGQDVFGDAVLRLLRERGTTLAEGMSVTPDVASSYTVVLNPPGVDRVFLHCAGANELFGVADVPAERLAGGRLLHFGYPPVMPRIYAADARELVQILRNARAVGLATSLDMCMPDPHGPAADVNWTRLLEAVLPHVDVFLPSLEETLFMLARGQFDDFAARGDILEQCSLALIAQFGARLLDMGAAVVGLKLGHHGLYVRTTSAAARFAPLMSAAGDELLSWRNRELMTPCFRADVVGTTGCGDATIAGFLMALLRASPLEEALTAAVGTGAFAAEALDAVSGIPAWEALQARIGSGWERHDAGLSARGWRAAQQTGIYRGLHDAT